MLFLVCNVYDFTLLCSEYSTAAPIKVNGGIISIFTGESLYRSVNRQHEYLDFIGEIATNFGSQVLPLESITLILLPLGRIQQ